MRHFRSILYALVLAPAVWVLAGVGLTHDLTARGRDDFAVESVTGLLLLVLAGTAYAILLFAPISPSGPLVGGLVYLGISAWALVSPGGYAGVWPLSVAKDGFDISRPGYGLAALLALPLVCTALSARRWARYEPPVLPLIGPVGRAVVRVGPAGPSPAASPYGDPDAGTLIRLPAAAPGSDDTTTVVAAGSASPTANLQSTVDPDATTLLPSQETAATSMAVGPASEDKTAETAPVVAGDPLVEEHGSPSAAPDSPVTASAPGAVPGSAVTKPSSEDRAGGEKQASQAGTASGPEVSETVAALAAEEPFKIGEVVDVAPEDEATIALRTFRDERRTTVVVSWDEAATVAALSNGQASTGYGPIAPPTDRPEVEAPPAEGQAPAVGEVPDVAAKVASTEDAGVDVSAAHAEPADELRGGESDETPSEVDERQDVAPGVIEAAAAGNGSTVALDEPDSGRTEQAADETERAAAARARTDQAATAAPVAVKGMPAPTEPEPAAQPASGQEALVHEALPAADATVGPVSDDDDDYVIDDAVETYVVGRAKPAPHTRAVPPEFEETRSLEAPDPDRTRAINLRELTTKLQVTPKPGEEPANEPIRARASVAAPDTTGPDLSGAEVTRSLSAPDPDRTQTIKVVTWNAAAAAHSTVPAPAPADDAETTRPLNGPDPDRTQTIKVVTSDDVGVVYSRGPVSPAEATDDAEVTRSFSAPDPDRTQAIAIVPAENGDVTRTHEGADPERTHLIRVRELAPHMRLLAAEPTADLAGHPGQRPGENTAAMTHTGDIGGDETQLIELDPDRTQLLGHGTVEPPGERTEIIRLPVESRATAFEPPTQPGPVSIADAERPDFAEDPTTRITPPDSNDPAGAGDGGPGHANATQDGAGRESEPKSRGMTVMSMERPPEEGPEIPAQRGPS